MRYFEILFLPIGWGQLNVLCTSGVTVITDGGSHALCFSRAYNLFRCFSEVKGIRRSNVFWILSHLDYDHFSIVAQYFLDTNSKIERCYFPCILAVPECRDMKVAYLALMMAIYEVRRIPSPPYTRVFGAINNICKQKIGIGRNYKLRLVDSQGNMLLEYHIVSPKCIYPDITKRCRRIANELRAKLKKVCKGDERCIRENIDKARSILEGITIESVEKCEPVDKIQVEDYETFNRDKKESSSLSHNLSLESRKYEYKDENIKAASEYLMDILGYEEYVKLRESMLNTEAIAYYLKTSISPIIVKHYYCIEPYCPIHYRHIVYYEKYKLYLVHDHIVNVYLSDLSGNELDDALSYMLNAENKNTLHPIVLVAAHHGNSWSENLTKIKPLVTWLSRCGHVNRKIRSNFKEDYLYLGINTVVSGHNRILRVEGYR